MSRHRYFDDVASRELRVEVADANGGRLDLRRRALLHRRPVLFCFASLHFHGETAAVARLVLRTHLLAVQHQRFRSVFLRCHLDVPHAFGSVRVSVADELNRFYLAC